MDSIQTIIRALHAGASCRNLDTAPAACEVFAAIRSHIRENYPSVDMTPLETELLSAEGNTQLTDQLRADRVDQDVALLQRVMQLLQILAAQPPEVADAIGVSLRDVNAEYVNIQDVIVNVSKLDEPPTPGEPPYKGLEFYDVIDADLFFGRETLTAELVDRLRRHSFLAVVGASGSGKSSLVRAGLVTALQRGEILADGSSPPAHSETWPVLILTPTRHPLENLADALIRRGNLVKKRETLIAEMRSDPHALQRYAQEVLDAHADSEGGPADARLVLVIDQFEELFTLLHSRDAQRQAEIQDIRRAFIDNVVTAATDPSASGSEIIVIITLRADFYAHCADYDNLRSLLEKRQKYIGAMHRDELRRAIEEPLQRKGWSIQPTLVDQLLYDVGTEPGALPLLSHALHETWKRRSGRTLTFAGYLATGRVQGSIAKTAESVYNEELTPQQRSIAKNMFLRLTELGEGAEDTRRRVDLDQLIPSAVSDRSAREAVLNELTEARLITTSIIQNADREIEEERGDGQAREIHVEVAHEALIREWPTLRRWLDENRESLRIQRHLTEAAGQWEKRGQDSGDLYRGVRLTQALEWAKDTELELSPRERRFLESSHRARKRRTFGIVGAIAALMGTLLIAALVFNSLRIDAKTEASRANAAERQSFARFLASEGQLVFEEEPLLALRLVVEGLALVRSDEAEARRSIAKAARELAKWGRLSKLGNDVEAVWVSPHGSVLVLDRIDAPGEVRSAADGSLIETLTAQVWQVHFGRDAGATLFVVDYESAPDEVRSTADGSLIETLTDDVEYIHFDPDADATVFVVDYVWVPSEVRSAANGALIETLPGRVEQVHYGLDPDATFFVADYDGAPGEVRSTADGSLIETLTGPVWYVHTGPDVDATFLVVAYDSAPGEVRSAADASLIETLSGRVDDVHFGPDADATFFVVAYDSAPGEVRSSADGSLIETLGGMVSNAHFSPDADANLFVVDYVWALGEVRSAADGSLVEKLTDNSVDVYFGRDAGATVFVVDYSWAPGEVRSTADGSLIETLPGQVNSVHFFPDTDATVFVVALDDAPSEVLSSADGSLIEKLTEEVAALYSGPDATVFVVDNESAPDEVRSTVDGSLVETLPDEVEYAHFLPDTDATVFVVAYDSAPGEFRSSADGSLIQTLSDRVADVHFGRGADAPFFVVDYDVAPSEVRAADGSLIQTLGGRVDWVLYSLDADSSDFIIFYVDGGNELWHGTDAPVFLGDLGSPVDGWYFDAINQRLSLRHSDGRAYLLDLEWLRAMGGDLAALSPEELERLACEGPLASGLLDEAAFEAYLDGRSPQACQ